MTDHTLFAQTRAGLAVVLCAVATVACPFVPSRERVVDPGAQVAVCTENEQCPQAHICASGTCVIGACDPALETTCDTEGLDSPYCCKAWEVCEQGPLSTLCVNDPDARGIGCVSEDTTCTPCEVQDDCGAGQFCSGAACFDAVGRTSCTSSFQCPGGERCDRTVFLCVPDRGGCAFCGPAFPELCCEEGQVCSEESGFCQDVPEPECGDDRACSNGLRCDDLERCVQCLNDDDCGPGLACDEGAGNCYSLTSVCDSDADCLGNKRCAVARRECVVPQCDSNTDCQSAFDRRWLCDVDQFACILPPAVCTEDDEENDSAMAATPLQGGAYAGVLCRDDTDFLSFPVVASKRYTVAVRFTGSGQPGIAVALLDTAQRVESSAVFGQIDSTVQLAGVTADDESGLFWVRVTGNNNRSDSWAYSVSVTESEPSVSADCSEAGEVAAGEPNDSFLTATTLAASVEGVTHVVSRCGRTDTDFYRIPVTAQHGIEVLVGDFVNAEGNLNAELYKAPNTSAGSRVDGATGITNVEALDAPEGPAEFFLKVFLGSTAGAVEEQSYSITVKEIPRPAACAPDTNEPSNDVLSRATAIELVAPAGEPAGEVAGGTTALRCNPQDVDHFAFTVPTNRSASVRLRFNHSEGNLKLDVLDTTGTLIPNGSSDVSTASSDPDEQVTVPGTTAEARSFIARVQLASTASAIIAQSYTIEVETYDDGVCLASEPEGGDGTFAAGICLGEATRYDGSILPCSAFGPEPLLGDCTAAQDSGSGCGLVCGNADSDFFRVGRLKNDQALHAVLTYDPALGALDLVRSSLTTAGGTPTESTVSDTDRDGRIELWHVETSETAKEYAVRVKPKGNTGHEQQPYALAVELGPECDADPNEMGAKNEKPSTATPLAVVDGAAEVRASRCHNDVDVYEVILLENERLTFALAQEDPSPTGLVADLGRRPADLNSIPPVVTTAAAGGSSATFDSDVRQVVYLTVRPKQGQTPAVLVTGRYTLELTVTPRPDSGG